MTQKEIQFINQFQATVLSPIQNDLISRKHKNWKTDPLSVTIEEILCSLSILPRSNGEFDLTYVCKGDIVKASYRLDGPIEHVDHSLWEVLEYLKYYGLNHGLLPLGYELDHLITGINQLLQIINPRQYGKFM